MELQVCHISPMCKSLWQSFYLRPLEITCISAVIKMFLMQYIDLQIQIKGCLFVDSELHLWIAIYIFGTWFTFVESDLHLWIGDLHLWIGDLHLWKVIYICRKGFRFVDWWFTFANTFGMILIPYETAGLCQKKGARLLQDNKKHFCWGSWTENGSRVITLITFGWKTCQTACQAVNVINMCFLQRQIS